MEPPAIGPTTDLIFRTSTGSLHQQPAAVGRKYGASCITVIMNVKEHEAKRLTQAQHAGASQGRRLDVVPSPHGTKAMMHLP